jgi:beta-glucanase (GH16 family)
MLTWSDEFTDPAGAMPDPGAWSAVTDGRGGGNQELEYYIPEGVAQDGDSHLVLTAARDNGTYPAWNGPSQFTSGKVWTKGKLAFRYGRLEVSASLPAGQPGAWPAIWLLGQNYDDVGWPACGEIDVMESFGKTPSVTSVSAAIHSETDNISQAHSVLTASDLTCQHVYTLDWRESSLIFGVDGTSYLEVRKHQMKGWPFSQPLFLIMNLAIGGTMGGAVPATAPFPYEMSIDYVRLSDSELVTAA